MKNIMKYIILIIAACALFSCSIETATISSGSAANNEDVIVYNEPGSVNVTLMIPDY